MRYRPPPPPPTHTLYFETTKKKVDEAGRFDAEYFQPKYDAIIKRIEAYHGGFDLVGNIVSFKNEKYEPEQEKEYCYISLADVSAKGYVNSFVKDYGKNLPTRARRKINTNDVIISSIGGSLEACTLIGKDFNNAICSTGFFVISSKKINPETLLVLFKSPIIQPLLERGVSGTILGAINQNELEKIKIPLFDKSTQTQIAEKIQKSFRLIKESETLYKGSETLLLEELGLVSYQPKHRLTFETTKKKVAEARRFDAEYFQPKYAEIIKRIEAYHGGFDLVGNIVNFKNRIYQPKQEKEYRYISLADVSAQGYINSFVKDYGKNLPTRARRKVNTNDVIISSIGGSLEACTLIGQDLNNALCSTGFFVISSKKINLETLLVLFKSSIIQPLLERGVSGTILGAINQNELEKIKLPLFDKNTQTQIAKKIQKSFQLRKESETLYDEAETLLLEELGAAPST